MCDRIRKIVVAAVFGTVIAGVWTLGAVKADLDSPLPLRTRVDPAIVQRAMLASQAATTAATIAEPVVEAVAENADSGGFYYLFAS